MMAGKSRRYTPDQLAGQKAVRDAARARSVNHHAGWTEDERNWLLEHWGERTVEQLAEDLGRTPGAVRIYYTRHTGKKLREERAKKLAELEKHSISPQRVNWTEEEDAVLRSLWGKYPLREIGTALGRTMDAAKHRKFLLVKKGMWK